MLIIPALSVLTAIMVWGIVYRLTARHAFDACALSLSIFALFQFTRALLIAFGLDTPFPDYLFGEYWDLIIIAQMMAILWLLSFLLGYLTLSGLVSPLTRALPYVRKQPDPLIIMIVNATLTLLAALVAIWLIARFGSFGMVQRAIKTEKALAGSYALRQFASIGLFSCATAFAYFQFCGGKKHPRYKPIYTVLIVAFFLSNLGASYIWAARGPIVFALGMLFISYQVYQKKGALNLLLGAAALFGIVFLLRIVRDMLITGEIIGTIADAHAVRAFTIAANMQEFDALMLVIRDWGDALTLRWGEDFYNGLAGIIPRAIWPDKPEVIAPGRWFRLYYQPSVINGWPFTAVGEWFINFWYPGIVIGGALSGLAIRTVQTKYNDFRTNPYSLFFMVIFAVNVFGGGIETRWPTSYTMWAVPLFILTIFFNMKLGFGAARAPAMEPPPSGLPQPTGLSSRPGL